MKEAGRLGFVLKEPSHYQQKNQDIKKIVTITSNPQNMKLKASAWPQPVEFPADGLLNNRGEAVPLPASWIVEEYANYLPAIYFVFIIAVFYQEPTR